MYKKRHTKSILVFFLFLVLNFSSFAQAHKYFVITGKVTSDSESADSGMIQIIKNEHQAITVQISNNGRFRLELDYNQEFKLTFSQKGFLPKTILVNTEIPQEVLNQPANLSNFLMTVKLIKDLQDEANLLPDSQIQQIKYSPQLNNFVRNLTVFNMEFVEKGNTNQNQNSQAQQGKSKM